MLYQLLVNCITDVGLLRNNNEDAYKYLDDKQFYIIADGMGGHQAGEVASMETVDQLCTFFQKENATHLKNIFQAEVSLKEMIQKVNESIYRKGREDIQLKGMGTTLCCLFFHPDGLIYGHVGDSRIYRFRQGHLEQLTQDHSLMRELINQGQLTEKQAEEFVYKNIITKAIGTEPYVEPTITHTSVQVEDILLMCTDGLSDLISFQEIQSIIEKNPLEKVTGLLVDKAKVNGGTDNITAILVKVQDIHDPHLS